MKFQIEFPRAVLFLNLDVSLAIGILLASVASQSLFADGPAARTAAIKGDVKNALELKPEHGPWLVFAMSFDGYNAKGQAERLATELRKDHKLRHTAWTKNWTTRNPSLVQASIPMAIIER